MNYHSGTADYYHFIYTYFLHIYSCTTCNTYDSDTLLGLWDILVKNPNLKFIAGEK